MIDISKGRYWDEGIKLISGCTRCSDGCKHCWSLAMEHRLGQDVVKKGIEGSFEDGTARGYEIRSNQVIVHPDRLTRFNTRKPKVFSIWNDLFHEAVPDNFQNEVYKAMILNKQNTYLILTKRPQIMARFLSPETCFQSPVFPHIWHGLTVCNQQEWDDKERWFLQIPGKKFISHEPALEAIHYGEKLALIDCLVSGGETGFGARPSHPDIFRSDRDQCAAAGVDVFFKQWGEWTDDVNSPLRRQSYCFDPIGKQLPVQMYRVGRKKAGRLLDGRTHDDLPWVKKERGK